MIRLILLVFIVMMLYSFIKSKKELEKKQAERDSINIKKNNAKEEIGIDEKISVQDKYGRVFILSNDRKVYVFDSKDNTMEEIKDIKNISTKRRYATAKAG